ncbi:hypothetical protein QUA43_22930 [Microcoleus sp. N9_B4]|uniref:hypothetical protein n=1 Tax=Microcoleus sp. N9_B4 TaxID=3055386 RepID=UPI002FD68284
MVNIGIAKIVPTAFLALSAHWCGDIAWMVLLAELKDNKGWGSIARSADPGQKPILTFRLES